MMKKKKRTRRLRRPYKILLAILCIAIVGGSAGYFITHYEPTGPEYGKIDEDVEITDEPMKNPVAEQEEGENYDLGSAPFTFTVLDVGQGQSIFIDYGDMEVLIDGGYPEYGESIVEKIKDKVDGDLDFVIATHSDADHVGGLSAVYNAFHVDKTIYGDLSNTTACDIFVKDAKANSNEFIEDSDTTLDLGKNATLTIFDVVDNAPDTNDNSIFTLIQYGETSFFASGDAGEEMERKLRLQLSECNVVVAGHHGSSTSNSLLDLLSPEYFVISAQANNEYGHPHKEVMAYARDVGSTIYGTWKSGDITFTSDGMSVFCSAGENDPLSVDDAGAIVKQNNTEKEEE